MSPDNPAQALLITLGRLAGRQDDDGGEPGHRAGAVGPARAARRHRHAPPAPAQGVRHPGDGGRPVERDPGRGARARRRCARPASPTCRCCPAARRRRTRPSSCTPSASSASSTSCAAHFDRVIFDSPPVGPGHRRRHPGAHDRRHDHRRQVRRDVQGRPAPRAPPARRRRRQRPRLHPQRPRPRAAASTATTPANTATTMPSPTPNLCRQSSLRPGDKGEG